jgi:hypothetical protein
MSEWQDISTAPKDGTRILLFANGRVSVGGFDPHWSGNCWVFIDPRIATGTGPTHWMPLPAPPSAKAMHDNAI